MAADGGAGRRRRVVIVGGGFGGLTAARELRRADVDVTLVDRTSHHLFQPLLYQLACGGLSTGECATPIRSAVKRASNTTVLMAQATELDVERRQVVLDRGERLDYDSLIVACGAETSYFGKDEWSEVSHGLKTLPDAVGLRNQIYTAFEEAERTDDPAERERWLTFVVIGGGPTGVELAGELAIVTRHTMKGYFARIHPSKARVILLDAGKRVTAAFSERLSGKVAKELASLGVTVREGARVTSIDTQGVTIQVGGGDERIAAKTVVWAAGVQAAGFSKTLAQATGVTADRAGRVPLEPDLTITGHPEISAIGDATQVAGPGDRPLPGLATVAIQQARHVAKAVRGGAAGATTPFRYFDKGALAVVGRGKAVCEIRGHELSGRPAFFTYLTVHMYYLSGGGPGHRLKVLIDWASTRVGDPQNQVIDGWSGDRGVGMDIKNPSGV
jgi:NADH:ubiquinone reductase (H+-translocating)